MSTSTINQRDILEHLGEEKYCLECDGEGEVISINNNDTVTLQCPNYSNRWTVPNPLIKDEEINHGDQTA